jgi:transposase
MVAKNRRYTTAFKMQVVRAAATGEKRPGQLAREFGISDSLLCKWRTAYEAGGEEALTPRALRAAAVGVAGLSLEQQVAALERFCGHLAWENAELKKALRHVAPSRSAMP